MKTLFFLMFICLAPCCLKAQESTLGKTKDQMRALVKPYPGIKLATGNNTDTLSMKGDLKTIVFYKNDTCYATETIMPLKLMDLVTQKMTKDAYKKIKDNLWISPSGALRVEITIDKNADQFITETTRADDGGSK